MRIDYISPSNTRLSAGRYLDGNVATNSTSRHIGDAVTVHGNSAGIHLSLQFNDPALSDVRVADAALEQGIVARALSTHTTGLRQHRWNGLLLGYSQVDGADMDALIRKLARLIRATVE